MTTSIRIAIPRSLRPLARRICEMFGAVLVMGKGPIVTVRGLTDTRALTLRLARAFQEQR